MRRPLRFALVLVLALVAAFASAPAGARAAAAPSFQTVGVPVVTPQSLTERPPGFTTTARQAIDITLRQPKIKAIVREHPKAKIQPYVFGGGHWEVNVAIGQRNYASVEITRDGHVLKVWSGLASRTYMVRGVFDALFRHWWVWLPFSVLFLVPFVDVRRWRRLLHLDLLALLSFGASYALLDRQHPEAAVWLIYPALGYLLVRMLIAGFRPRTGNGRLVPYLPTAALLVGVIALFGARVALNVASGDRVMDIGYASVVGADRIAHKQELYVDNDNHGDTYGPFNYLFYVPFELAFPWHGTWDALPAAHAAALFFDLMTLLGLFLLGRQMRAGPEGRRLGLALAWAWAAYPFTLFGLTNNVNDGLVAMLLVYTLLGLTSPAVRGALTGVAAAAKFTPGALVLLVARGRGEEGRRAWWTTVLTCAGVFAFAFAMYMPAGGLKELWNCTLGFQLGRTPDFSAWAIVDGFEWTQKLLEAFAIGLALYVGLKPSGRRTTGQVAALAAAVTIAIQLPAGHWFYFYLIWFMPLVLFALFAEHRDVAAVAQATDGDDADLTTDDEAPALGGVGLGRLAA